MTLLINLATRKRPQLLAQTIEKTLGNIAEHGATRLMVSLDHDDPEGAEVCKKFGIDVLPDIREREDSLGEKYNRALDIEADAYLVMVDYAPMATRGFDLEIIEAASSFGDGYAMIYGPHANASFPCINAVTRKMALAMGGIYPAYFPYWFVDHWFDDVGRMINRIVTTRVFSDAALRPDTMERREPGFWATFFDATHAMRVEAALRVVDAGDFNAYRGQRDDLMRLAEVVRKRSHWINDNVRRIDHLIANPSRDERYERIKANALRVLNELGHAAQAA